jgi:hypothetical protein
MKLKSSQVLILKRNRLLAETDGISGLTGPRVCFVSVSILAKILISFKKETKKRLIVLKLIIIKREKKQEHWYSVCN